MTCTRFRTVAIFSFFGLALPATGAGCASLGIDFGLPHQAKVEPAQVRPRPQPPTEGETQATLAAVEEFLARTEEYDAAASPPASAAQPDVVHDNDPASRAPAGSPMARPSQPTGTLTAARSSWSEDNRAFANTHVALNQIAASPQTLALPVVQSISIYDAPPLAATTPESPRYTAANQPLDMAELQTPILVDELVEHLKTRLATAGDATSEWRLRLTQLAFDRGTADLAVSSGLDEPTQDVLSAFLHAAVAVRAVLRDSAHHADSALQRVDQLRGKLLQHSDLEVKHVSLCRKVVTFGVYDEMRETDFVAGRTLRTIVYSEVGNFGSELTEDGHYRTELSTRLEILTADGQSVWAREEPEIVDLCRRRRNDFFIAQRVTLPPTLPADDYVLKVLIEDRLSGKVDEVAHPFAIRSALSAVSGG